MVVEFILGFVVAIVFGAVAAAALVFRVSRPARGRYRVHYHRFDAEGLRIEGSYEVEAMNEQHAESMTLTEKFGENIDGVELVEDLWADSV